MKVIFLGTLPPVIGLSPYCLHLATAVSEKIDLVFLGFKDFSHKSRDFKRESKIDESYYSDSLKKLKIQNSLSWYNPFSSLKASLKLNGDVLHVQWWISSLFAIYLPIIIMAKLKKIKIVVSVHNILPHEKSKSNIFFDKIVNKIIFSFADEFIVHNLRNKEKLIEIYSLNEDKISIITHGIFSLYKTKGISQENAKKHLCLPIEKKVLLFFGYIREYKGLDVLIKAFASLKKEMEDVILLIAGQTWKENWNKYEMLIKENNLEESVVVELGFVPESDIEYYFAASDIVVLPYKYLDTHGGVGAMALTFKKPLISTDVGGSLEYVKDKMALVKPNDAQDLYNKLVQILKDEKLLAKLSKDSEELSKTLSWDKIADKTIDVYKKTADRP